MAAIVTATAIDAAVPKGTALLEANEESLDLEITNTILRAPHSSVRRFPASLPPTSFPCPRNTRTDRI